jgi:hypothetical protein
VNFHSLRNILAGSVLALVTAVIGGCGGGGASNTTQGGALSLVPPTATIYAGIPIEITPVGGRAPYILGSSEPGLLAVPQSVNGPFTVVANNPGVVDVGLDPNEVPRRSVNINVRDSLGTITSSFTYNVLQNFLTGYGIGFRPGNCPTGALVCAGSDTSVEFNATFNGNLAGNREFRLDVIRGPFFWVHPTSGISGNSVTVRSDHGGRVAAILRVNPGVPTQVGILRITDVATGVYVDHSFTITGVAQNTVLVALPNSFSFTGPNTATCGTGVGDFVVFDGLPPYSAASSNPNVTVTPISPDTNPGRFRIAATNPNVCISNATVVVTDSLGGRTVVTVSTAPGTTAPAAPPPPPLTAAPNSITLGCGQTGSVTVIGGIVGATRAASSVDPHVTATINGNVLTITRAGPAGVGSAAQNNSQVQVTDGSSITTVSVTNPASCPT